MSEIWFMASGVKHWMNLFESNMQSQPFFINGVASNGERFQTPMLGLLDEVKLFRYIVPKEGVALAMKSLNFDKENLLKQKFKPHLWMMRKGLGLKEIPENLQLPNQKFLVATDNIQIIPVGIKEDEERLFPSTGVTQQAI